MTGPTRAAARRLVRAGRSHVCAAQVSAARHVPAYWFRGRVPNVGDELTPILMARMTGRRAVHVADVALPGWYPVQVAVGSILETARSPNVVVWGSGFIRSTGELSVRTARVTAVRGPMTAARLRAQGVACPDVFGDPGLLVPLFFPRAGTPPEGPIGVIPHWSELDHPAIAALALGLDARVVDVRRPLEEVLADLWACSLVVSSSLHGLILADAYRVPSVWLKLSERALRGGFKFCDYFGSVGRHDHRAVDLRDGRLPSPLEVAELARLEPLDVDLAGLVSACPWPVAEREALRAEAGRLSEAMASA